MTIIVNWIELEQQIESCIEIPLFDEVFLIYFCNKVITRTEWRLKQQASSIKNSHQWQSLHQYLNKPSEPLTVNLKKQGTDYRHKVWAEMCKIPVGQTCSYSELAGSIGSGARAVANACRDNPFPGIIPCHRVVAVSGIGGYMGQTEGRFLDIKAKLLANEAAIQKRVLNNE